MKPDLDSVLCMSAAKISRQKIRRHYKAWRSLQGLPERCDNQNCRFFSAPLLWNDWPLPLILDHQSGNASDNRPDNLRFLCPNCDSQNVLTRGGANADRIKRQTTGSYSVHNRDGTQDAYVNGAKIGQQVSIQQGILTPVVTYPDVPDSGAKSDA